MEKSLRSDMNNLIEFITRHIQWLLFALLEIVSIVLLVRFNGYQGSVFFTSANAVAGKLYELDSSIGSYFALSDVNKDLTFRNVQLEHEVSELRQQLDSLHEDSVRGRFNQLELLKDYKLIPAKVVSNSLDRTDNLITIDRGEADGVRKDMGVVCGTGVVGIVYLTSEHYSVLIPVLNSTSNVSCTIRGRGYFGYLHWDGGSSKYAYVDDVPRHAHFKLYDEVVTSGYSSVFPPGVLVGKILHVFNSKDGLSYRLQVALSTDFGRLRDVCVIDDKQLKERLDILRAAQDSIKVKQEDED